MVLPLLVAGALAATTLTAASAASAAVPDKLVFPIVGPAWWTDDFGAPRAQGGHEGNDILSDWKAPVVAVEPGKVRIWNRDGSGPAGCMLYLYGKSGTTYLYIHLNNDLTPKNDGKGGCKPGVAFAPGLEDGQRVRAGQLLGYVGSSGDAGATNHLHFELHPGNGAAVSPYRWLKRAERPLFAVADQQRAEAGSGSPTLELTGTLKSVETVEAPAPAPGEGASEQPDADAQPEPEPQPAPSTPASGTGTGGAGSSPPPPGSVPVIGARAADVVTKVRIRVERVELSTGEVFKVERDVVLTLADGATVERERAGRTRPAKLAAAKTGEKVVLTTAPIQLGLRWQLARPGTLSATSVLLRGLPQS